ncbi:MAG TPA: GTPase ObgE [Actinomycetota bacterium]|nr:GTPase ObgE [Actinomycetota bacterium]
MAFVDECTVEVQAGRGGDGSASMHSEPYKPRGGPDGGNGGRGGSVVFEVSSGVHDLSGLADHPHQRAESGKPGRSSRRDGATGRDLVVPVPDGVVVSDDQGFVADLVGEGFRAIVARGGRGGRGNAALAGPKNRVPRSAERGEPGESRRLSVELRTVADVGLVGFPNAGKSTLLSRLTAARPKVADYPFTTLTPNLGVAGDDDRRYVVADIPGLVEGASEGKGLGHRFLRHIVRCRALVMIVDLSATDPAEDLVVLRRELAAYDPELAERPAIVVGTKADLLVDPPGAVRVLGAEALAVSALDGRGLEELTERLGGLAARAEREAPERKPTVVLRPGREAFTVSAEGPGRWLVAGRAVERWVQEADLDDEHELSRLQRRLRRAGVERRLAAAGARHGEDVCIAGHVFEFLPEPSEEA